MDRSDIFVLLDRPLFNRRGFTHRNRIKTPGGELLLTVPIREKNRTIHDLIVDDEQPWRRKHYEALNKNYARAKYWKDHQEIIHRFYERPVHKLVELTIPMIEYVKTSLGIKTPVVLESELGGPFGTGSERIAKICAQLGADVYLSGNGAAAYNDPTVYDRYGIQLQYQNFRHPVYEQLWGSFIGHLSILDLLFNCGPEALSLIRQDNPQSQ